MVWTKRHCRLLGDHDEYNKLCHNLAEQLDQAKLQEQEVERITLKYPELSLQDAYQIQNTLIQCYKKRGKKLSVTKWALAST